MEGTQTRPVPHVGQKVIFTDPVGVDHDALVTAVWGETCVNVVYVSGDESRRDSYGRQVERNTSVTHGSTTGWPHGNYWRFDGEPKNGYKPPLEV